MMCWHHTDLGHKAQLLDVIDCRSNVTDTFVSSLDVAPLCLYMMADTMKPSISDKIIFNKFSNLASIQNHLLLEAYHLIIFLLF